MTLLEQYEKSQAIREWNARFRVPPVSTGAWNDDDWKRWEESRKPLPPFDEWAKTQSPS